MTLLEALVALSIAALVITAGIEASRDATERSALARLDIEATNRAASLLAAINPDDVRDSGTFIGHDANRGLSWRVDVDVDAGNTEFGNDAIDVTASVHIARGGLVADRAISELKLKADGRR